ncbi:hypothetical protein PTSG_06756 [Salpingoeca rosetta]|uniref:Uncharacterized protein n=1 Tax=Salpingoeca rosetta (strain ATCC 50818 / BSB-021) TaxID=946362 RepID=F2UEQ1_SALR5|nr:uncharacterized protein PTSG_06756 [Salpingoeca rosetta]EGD75101.1 hypothetical protein PTSG_06756 [Salpingoeca rosetta]|eukprot:XP_004992154.1 hypothetical protein PTSG_06756 [Salpingoeca rosetta]
MKTVLEVLDKCDEAARARDKMLLRDQVRELMTACGNLSETSSNESGEALATKAKELVNTVVEVFTQDFTEKSNAKLQAAINSVRNAANSVVPRGDSEKPPEFNPYDNFNDKGQLDDIYEYDPQYNPDTTFSNDGDLDGADPIYADTAHQQPISDGSDSDTSVHSDDEDLDVDATQASLGSSMRSIRKRPTINRTLSIDPEEDTADTPRATPALSKDIEYHVEVIESELDHLYSAAEVWDIKRMASTAKALFQAFSTLRKFAGHERDLPQDLERVYQSVKAASVSVTAYLHNFAQSGHSEATEPAIMDSIINLSVVMHDFIAGMRRLKFLSTVTERPAHHLMTRIQECFDVSATPHTDDKCECVDFVHCKQTLLHCSQALLSSLQQLTAAILAPCPVTWKLASICDNVAWHMQRLVHTSDLLHGGKPSPLRRLSFETCQVLLGGVALLCKPGDLTSNEFHAAVNSLHDSIPALRDSTQQLFTECFQLATNGEIRELTQKELDADIDVKVKLDLSAAHAEPEQQPDMKTVAVDGYLCTKTFKDVITSQAYQIGHIVSLSNMPRDTTIAQVKDAFTQKYDTPAAASLQLLSPEHELTDDTKLEDYILQCTM